MQHERLAQLNRQNRVEADMQRKIESVQKVRLEKQTLRKDLVEQRQVAADANRKKSQEIKASAVALKKRKEKEARKKAIATKKAYEARVRAEEEVSVTMCEASRTVTSN